MQAGRQVGRQVRAGATQRHARLALTSRRHCLARRRGRRRRHRCRLTTDQYGDTRALYVAMLYIRLISVP